jgi:hypothetical protein
MGANRNLTAEEARELSVKLLEVEEKLKDFRRRTQLMDEDEVEVKATERNLLDACDGLDTLATGLTLANAQEDLAKIHEAINEAKNAIATLEGVRKVLTIAGAVLQLATAIASKDPGAALSAADAVIQAIAT